MLDSAEDNAETTEEQLVELMSMSGILIKHIIEPSEAVQLAAVKQNGHVIKFISNPSEAVQLAAMNQISSS
jgi:hypothetical protein